MKKFLQILFVAAVLLTSTFAAAQLDDGGYFEAEGVIYPESDKPNRNEMRRMAIMDAYRYLAEEVDALNVTATSTVKNLRELDDEINTRVETALRGAKVVSAKLESDGSFHAIVRLPKNGAQSITAAVLKPDVVVEDFPKPRFTNVRSEVTYTGLVVDCRGLNLSEAISPVIKSSGGTEVYAYKNVGYDNAVNNGLVEYSADINSPRAGATPLVVKAVQLSDKCDVVVSDEDADKILDANQTAKFLINCAVVLVR